VRGKDDPGASDRSSGPTSWALPPSPRASANGNAAEPTRGGLRRRLTRHNDDFSWVDVAIIVVCLAFFDFVGILIVSGWQTLRCGSYCGLRTQLHLVPVATVVLVVGVVLPPLLAALVLGRNRALVVALQLLLCLGILVNSVTDQHRIKSRLDGTATCWNPAYSNRDCPWGPKG
jgi:hypothetical protein